MKSNNRNPHSSGLPYLNNFWIILGTALLNAACVVVFHWNQEITWMKVVNYAVFCGIITSGINILITAHYIEKMRKAGTLPAQTPISRFMLRLPKNKFLLILLFAVFFGAFAALANFLILRFYEITSFNLVQFAVWQAAYSCVLSSIIIELAVLRLVQPDCAKPGQPPQTGTAQVHNPLPKFSSLKSWFNTITDDFGFNMAVGLILGGTIITADYNVVITPTTQAGIVVSSLILGIIVTLRMAYPINKSMFESRESGALPQSEQEGKWLSRLPYKPWKFTAILMVPIMLLSLLAFWAVLIFFDFEVLNFFQFFVIRTVFVAILTKGVVALSLARYQQKGGTRLENLSNGTNAEPTAF